MRGGNTEAKTEKKKRRPLTPPLAESNDRLHIIVQAELVRMRPQRHRIDFVLLLVADPGINYVFREYIAAEQEFMVLSQRVERLAKRTRGLRHLGQLLRREI